MDTCLFQALVVLKQFMEKEELPISANLTDKILSFELCFSVLMSLQLFSLHCTLHF